MSHDGTTDATARLLGALIIAGCVLAIVADLLTASLSGKINPVADTISNAAAGRYDWIADGGLYAFAIAAIATAIGLKRWRIERLDWVIGAWMLVLVAILVTAIACYEAYSTGEGPVIHRQLVYALGAAFPLTVLLTAGQFYEFGKRLGIALYIGGALWAVMGPGLFFIPTGYDGGYERLLAMMMLGWFIAMGVIIWRNPDVVRHLPAEQRGVA